MRIEPIGFRPRLNPFVREIPGILGRHSGLARGGGIMLQPRLTGTALYLVAQELLNKPASDDGLVAWNFLDRFLEPHKVLPLYKLIRSQNLATTAH